MNQRVKYLLKNTGILTIGSFSSKILVFLLVPLYTSVLSTEQYGAYDLVNTTVQMLMPILTVSIYEGVMRFVMDETKQRDQVITVGIKYLLIGTAVFSALLGLNVVFRLWEFAADYALYIWMFFFFSLLYQFASQLARGFEQVKVMAVAGVISTVIIIAGNLLFLLVFSMELKGFFLSYIISYIVPDVYILCRIRIWRYVRGRINKPLEKELISYSAPLVLNTLGWWANSALDRYIVTWLCGISVNGIYSVSYKIPSILNTMQGIFVQAWQISAIKENVSKDSPQFYGRILDTVNFLMSACCMVLIALTIPIARILFAKDFFEAWQFAPFLLLSCVINVAGGVLGPILSAKKNSKAMANAALFGALSNLILNIILVHFMGAQGAAIATAISSMVIFQMRLKAVGRENIDIDYKRVVFPWVLMTIQSAFMIWTKLYFVQIIIVIFFVVFHREYILDLLKKGRGFFWKSGR